MTTEGERLTRLETQMDNIENKVDDLKDILTKFIEKSEDRFASKWVEDAMKWGVGLVMAIVITAITYLVVNK